MGNLTRGQVVFWVIFASALVVLAAVVMSYPVQRPVGEARVLPDELGYDPLCKQYQWICPQQITDPGNGDIGITPPNQSGCRLVCVERGPDSGIGIFGQQSNFYPPIGGPVSTGCPRGFLLIGGKCRPSWFGSDLSGDELGIVGPGYGQLPETFGVYLPPGAGGSGPGGGSVPVVPDPYAGIYSPPGSSGGCTFCNSQGPGIDDQGCRNICKSGVGVKGSGDGSGDGGTCPPPGYKLTPII